jgi:hypothetical protein
MILLTSATPHLVFDLNKTTSLKNWQIVDDGVMGGKSNGYFKLNAEGHGIFSGDISLKNNGGFSSVRYNGAKTVIEKHTKIKLTVKGDGKSYQFRLKANAEDYYSYTATFKTTGKWETIEIPLKSMYPTFRGRTLDQPNFEHQQFEAMTFFIGNKIQESFKLLIDKIELL